MKLVYFYSISYKCVWVSVNFNYSFFYIMIVVIIKCIIVDGDLGDKRKYL